MAIFPSPMLEPASGLDESHSAVRQERHAPRRRSKTTWSSRRRRQRKRRGRRAPIANLIKGAVAALVFIVVGGLLLWQWPNMVALYSSFRAPAVETVRETPPPANTRPKITDRIEPGTQQAPATPAPGAVPGAGAAQKVVLYEEDPADPNGKRFVGSAIWRTETVTPGPGQPPELAIRADVEVPERKLAMTFSFRRNTDKGLPATHTVEIKFKLPADFPAGGISNVPGILMKTGRSRTSRRAARRGLRGESHARVLPGRPVQAGGGQEPQSSIAQGAGLVRHPWSTTTTGGPSSPWKKAHIGERAFAEAFKAWKQ
jgi:hypothetical protein